MSTSRPRSKRSHLSSSSKQSTRDASATAEPACDRTRARPWIQDGIDYGPAILAIRDLATWAFDVAERDVADWPEGLHRVHTARRFVLARIRGKRARRVPFEDVVFTAGLLARIFDDELRLGMNEVVAIFDALHLPTELVPLSPRPAPRTGAMRPVSRAQVSPLRPVRPLRPCPTAFVVAEPDGACDECDECGEVHPFVWPDLSDAA